MVLLGILPTHHETQAHCAPSLDCTFSNDPQQTSGLHRAVWSSVNHNFVPLVASLIEMTSKMRLGMGPFLNSARGPTRCQHEPTLLRHREDCKLRLYVSEIVLINTRSPHCATKSVFADLRKRCGCTGVSAISSWLGVCVPLSISLVARLKPRRGCICATDATRCLATITRLDRSELRPICGHPNRRTAHRT